MYAADSFDQTRRCYARLVFSDGEVLTDYGDDPAEITKITVNTAVCGSESVSIGGVNTGSCTVLTAEGPELEDRSFQLYFGQEVDGAPVWVPMGVYTVTKAELSDGQLTAEAWDALYFTGTTYTPSEAVQGECTLASALADVCLAVGMTFSGTLPDVTITGMPTGLTISAAIGHLAALCGCNACMDRNGYLVFRWFTESGQTLTAEDCYQGGLTLKSKDFYLAALTNTLTVTGEDGESETQTVTRSTGVSGGGVTLENPLMTEDNIGTAWETIQGFTYRAAELSAMGRLDVDAGDVLTVTDTGGTSYSVPVMSHTLEYDGGLKSSVTASGESESQQSAPAMGPLAQQVAAMQATVNSTVTATTDYYALSDSTTTAPTEGWSVIPPDWTEGQYLWKQTATTYANGAVVYGEAVCLAGASGADGADAVVLRIDSSRGTVFKNNAVSTVLSAVIYSGGLRITDGEGLAASFGSGAWLEWSWQRLDEDTFGTISSSDSRLSEDGFSFTLSPDDVDTKVVFQCSLNV